MNHNSLFRIYSALVLYHHNMKIIHWGSCGCHFDDVHKISDDYASKISTHIDEIAEIMMMCTDMKPLSLESVLEFAKDDDGHEYHLNSILENKGTDFFKDMACMFDSLVNLYEEACHTDLPGDVISRLQEHQYYYRLEYKYKLTRRMIDID